MLTGALQRGLGFGLLPGLSTLQRDDGLPPLHDRPGGTPVTADGDVVLLPIEGQRPDGTGIGASDARGKGCQEAPDSDDSQALADERHAFISLLFGSKDRSAYANRPRTQTGSVRPYRRRTAVSGTAANEASER